MSDRFSFDSADDLIELLKKANDVIIEKNQKLMKLYNTLGDSFRDNAYDDFKRELLGAYSSCGVITAELETTITGIENYRNKLYELYRNDASSINVGSAQKVLKKDSLTLLLEGASAIEHRLEVKADDYRDKNYTEEEITELLKSDKLAYQREFLDDAFPGEYVSENVFNNITPASNNIPKEQSQALKTIDTWITQINPKFDPFDASSPYCNNCGSCAYAVYQRLEGNDKICATSSNIGYNHQMEALTGLKQVPMSPDKIKAYLLSKGNGAHAIIGVDRAFGPGHWFNAVCIDGKVFAVDGQNGTIIDWPPDYGSVVNWEISLTEGEYFV